MCLVLFLFLQFADAMVFNSSAVAISIMLFFYNGRHVCNRRMFPSIERVDVMWP